MTTDQNIATAAAGNGERADAPAASAKKPRRRAKRAQGATQEADTTSSATKIPTPEKISSEASGAAGQRRRRAAPKKPAPKTVPLAAVSVDAAPQAPAGQEHASKELAREPSAAPQEGADAGEPGRRRNSRARRDKTETSDGRRRMFVSVLPGEQVEVALVEDGIVQEYYLDMLHQRKIKGNIYKGVVQNIDTNLQAAFVNFGMGKNGFLQIDEIHPEYWQAHHEPGKGKKFPPIQKVLKVGQDVLVQVVKEPTGNKGAFLTTWLSLAGRFLVLTPGQEQTGVSRKVENGEERDRLRELMGDIDPGPELGVIVRTVSEGATKTTLKIDLQYLKRVWRDIRKKATEVASPALVYQEPGLSERAVRDYLTDDVTEVWLDDEDTAERVRETASLLFPRKKNLIHLHTDTLLTLWERFSLRRQLDQIYSREVILPSGGRLVFDQTEALMAVDVNSGKISGKANFEAMAYKTNLEAAEIVARQIKLRDVGGQVVIDFIEMREKKHTQEVEKTLRQAMKNDRARHDVGHISPFGLLELVRQRTGSSALAITMEPCPACGGTGQRRNLEWQALQALRDARRLLRMENGNTCRFESRQEVALYLLNHKRDTLRELEQEYGKCLEVTIRL
ncbi:MAG: Rne/Rng family ribonuclease [Desulfovibrio sp.]|jgi:ribonuclease E|nr:Rne/Rng family ribonuclease [Desulfovibrio sp.]